MPPVLVNVSGVDWPRWQLVRIGDRVVCARVLGSGPTVVLEAGGAGGAGEGTPGAYGDLEERLAAYAIVLTYDRAGSGRSDGTVHGRVAQMADDLDGTYTVDIDADLAGLDADGYRPLRQSTDDDGRRV